MCGSLKAVTMAIVCPEPLPVTLPPENFTWLIPYAEATCWGLKPVGPGETSGVTWSFGWALIWLRAVAAVTVESNCRLSSASQIRPGPLRSRTGDASPARMRMGNLRVLMLNLIAMPNSRCRMDDCGARLG